MPLPALLTIKLVTKTVCGVSLLLQRDVAKKVMPAHAGSHAIEQPRPEQPHKVEPAPHHLLKCDACIVRWLIAGGSNIHKINLASTSIPLHQELHFFHAQAALAVIQHTNLTPWAPAACIVRQKNNNPTPDYVIPTHQAQGCV